MMPYYHIRKSMSIIDIAYFFCYCWAMTWIIEERSSEPEEIFGKMVKLDWEHRRIHWPQAKKEIGHEGWFVVSNKPSTSNDIKNTPFSNGTRFATMIDGPKERGMWQFFKCCIKEIK